MSTHAVEFLSESDTRPGRVAVINPANIDGLDACIEDARQAAGDQDPGPPEPDHYTLLLGRLEAIGGKFSPVYRDAMVTPFFNTLRQIGEAGFRRIVASDPQRQGVGGLMMDIAQALLQHGEEFSKPASDAFEEVVSDLYDGFLSAEDRQGVNPPDLGVVPPLVKWGNPSFGPYTWPVDATSAFGCKAAVVNLPPANSRKGLVAWSALGHETAGHDILHADTGLQAELSEALQRNLGRLGHDLDQYWSSRIDETAADVMGILNLGPAAGIGLVAYFRALNAAFTGQAKLRSEGPVDDPHPADVLRGYLAAETVALLKFSGHRVWSQLIANETNKDVETIALAGEVVSEQIARQSAKIVAQTLAGYRAKALENHALGQIQNWSDGDERKVAQVRAALRTGGQLPASPTAPIYAAHAVAGAVTEALANGSQLDTLFIRMIAVLDALRQGNPACGPLFVVCRGNLKRDLVYWPGTKPRSGAPPRQMRLVSSKITSRRKSVGPVKLPRTRPRG
jgi:hypothetical protein